jgi:hypothetical protein
MNIFLGQSDGGASLEQLMRNCGKIIQCTTSQTFNWFEFQGRCNINFETISIKDPLISKG